MDLVTIGIWIALALIAVGILSIVLFAIRNIASGKFRVFSLVAMVLPLAIFGLSYALSAGSPQPFAQAMIFTALILLALGALAILLTGLKGLIGF